MAIPYGATHCNTLTEETALWLYSLCMVCQDGMCLPDMHEAIELKGNYLEFQGIKLYIL